MIQIGQKLPDATLKEFIDAGTPGCSLGPNEFKVSDLVRKRYAMLVEDGVVKTLDVQAPGKFEVSDAQSMLRRLG